MPNHSMTPSRYALDLDSCLSPPEHLWVNSGWSTVQPLAGRVCGVGACHAPPFSTPDLRLELEFMVNGHRIPDIGSRGKGDCGLLFAGGTWQPDRIERKGTYHHLVGKRVLSLEVRSILMPLFGVCGYRLEIEIQNRGRETARISASPSFSAGHPGSLPLSGWEWMPAPAGSEAVSVAPNRWCNGAVEVRMRTEETRCRLQPGAVTRMAFTVTLSEPGSTVRITPDSGAVAWEKRLADFGSRFPQLETSDQDLARYYDRSLLSGLVCLWENPAFALHPWIATSGMDGRALSAYVWDTAGYSPLPVCWLMGGHAGDLLCAFHRMGLEAANQLTPGGTPAGRWYSFNQWAFLNLGWTIARWRGLDEPLFALLRDCFLTMDETLPKNGDLAFYGGQANLLEMRALGWEGIVASPNAERAWGYERLADMATHLGLPGASDWRKQSRSIREDLLSRLWDGNSGWFRPLPRNGPPQIVQSIQVYDVMRAGVCPVPVEKKLLSHLKSGVFLGDYGISSVAKTDSLHYEVNDPDWSGSGAYTGELPVLALTLWERGHADAAWDVLRRQFWLAKHLPYYPQEHYCDRPAVPAHKRGNCIAGVAGTEAVVGGLFGIVPDLAGNLNVDPQPPDKRLYALDNIRFRGCVFALRVEKGTMRAYRDGKQIYKGPIQRISLNV